MHHLFACGVNHKSAPLTLRERLVFSEATAMQSLGCLVQQTRAQEAAILSTCNRTEIYCVQTQPLAVIDWLAERHQVPRQSLEQSLYIHQDEAAVRHLMRVASGLDSMIVGEPQIFGQVKSAFTWALQAGTLGRQLRHLFQFVFSVTKQIRRETTLGAHSVSVAAIAVDLAKQIFADLTEQQVLLIGAGEIAELTARYLYSQGVRKFWVANRTLARAHRLAREIGGQELKLEDIPKYLAQADIVIAATASSLPIIGKGLMERTVKVRKHKPIYMLDLAVPRNVEPEVGSLADVYLYMLDDFRELSQTNLQARHAAAQQAEAIIVGKAECYIRSLQVINEGAPIVRAYRNKAIEIRDQELVDAQRLFANGMSMEQVIQRLAIRLTNKLLHEPSIQLRKAAYENQEEILNLARRLFGIKIS